MAIWANIKHYMDKLYLQIENVGIYDYLMYGYYQKLLSLQKLYNGKINIKLNHTSNIINVWVSLPKYQFLKHYILNIHNLAIIYQQIENDIMKLIN